MGKLSDFLRKCKRVLMVATKPDIEEIKLSVKITGLGITIIGIIGFIIFLLFQVLSMHGISL